MRLFFGLPLPEDIRLAAAAHARACAAVMPGRYVREDNYHITLAFLGDVPPERVSEAAAVLHRRLSAFPAPSLSLGETGFFGREQNAILILHVLSDPPLDSLHDALIGDLLASGLPCDKGPFSPHITLARHVSMTAPPCAPLPLRFTPDCAHLYLSARNSENILVYTPLESAPFAVSPVGER